MQMTDNDPQLVDWWTEQPVTKFLSYISWMDDWGRDQKKKMKQNTI